MKKQATSKSKGGAAQDTARKASSAKAGKPAAKGSREAAKGSQAGKPAARKAKSTQPTAPKSKPSPKTKPTQPTASKSKPSPKTKSTPATAPKSKPSPKTKSTPATAPKSKPSRVAAPVVKAQGVLSREADLEPHMAAGPRAMADSKAEVTSEEEGALRNVMASLTSIFGGRDFISDAELDALLDDKMASGELPPSAALDPLDEAQSLIYEAWNSEGPQRARLAHRALETSPDCADAYVILAEEEAKDRREALALYRKGVEAGERALDPSVFHQSAGKFWEIMETRPYMRARLGLAECLWETGKKDEALGHLRDLLRLNPADNQGVRYILAQCLLETGAEGELGDMLERFRGDRSPQIRFSHALWMFRHEGPGRKADALLAEAVKSNPHVPDYLLKRKKLPRQAPDHAAAGSEEEAAAYAMGAVDSWHRTLGASDWLEEKTR